MALALWLADELRAAGLRVIEVNGWKDRYQTDGRFNPQAVVCHHDASGFGDSPSVVDFMSNLKNNGAQLWISRSGTVFVLASGRMWHAGAATTGKGAVGTSQWNEKSIGIETDHTTNEDWPDAQLKAFVVAAAVIANKLGCPTDMVVGHKEIQSGNPDPDGVDMTWFRSQVDYYRKNGFPGVELYPDSGFDYSAFQKSGQEVRKAGGNFALRYLKVDGAPTWRVHLDATELQALLSGGVDVGMIWQHPDRMRSGKEFNTGVLDGLEAARQARSVGGHEGVIYFTTDTELLTGAQVADYFDGVVSVLGIDQVGWYGSYFVLEWLRENRGLKYGWQTKSWSQGNVSSWISLYQHTHDVTNALGNVDINERYRYAGLIGEGRGTMSGQEVWNHQMFEVDSDGNWIDGEGAWLDTAGHTLKCIVTLVRDLRDATAADRGKVEHLGGTVDALSANVVELRNELNRHIAGGTEGTPGGPGVTIDYDLLANKVADKLSKRLAD